jgi:hypothetical protein
MLQKTKHGSADAFSAAWSASGLENIGYRLTGFDYKCICNTLKKIAATCGRALLYP